MRIIYSILLTGVSCSVDVHHGIHLGSPGDNPGYLDLSDGISLQDFWSSVDSQKYDALELRDIRPFVNSENEFGRTPLSIASYRGDLRMVKILLENGADVNTKDSRDFGKYPL